VKSTAIAPRSFPPVFQPSAGVEGPRPFLEDRMKRREKRR